MWKKYATKKRKNEAGPVALLNLGKKLGMHFGYRQYIKRFRSLCRCIEPKDPVATETNFDSAIKKIFGWVGPMTKLVAPWEKDFYALLESPDNNGMVIRLTTGEYVCVNQSGVTRSSDVDIAPYGARLNYTTLQSMFGQTGFTVWAIKSLL